MEYAAKSDAKEFIIGTEVSIREHLQYKFPEKKFYDMSKRLLCQNMKATTLMDVLNTVKAIGGDTEHDAAEIIMSDELISKARVCIDEMIRLGG